MKFKDVDEALNSIYDDSIIELTIEEALIRWSLSREIYGSDDVPHLQAFLAGWFCRVIHADTSRPKYFPHSFMVGWREADETIQIKQRQDVMSQFAKDQLKKLNEGSKDG